MGDAVIRPCRCGCETYVFGDETRPIEIEVLLANLAVAAGLCESFRRGQRRQYAHYSQQHGHAYDMRANWEPGCNRSAPGFEGK